MDYFVTSEGEAQLLRNMVGVDMTLHLFVNDLIPTRGASRKSFKEPVGSGYRPIVLNPSRWKISGDPAEAAYPQVTYTFQAAVGRIYGYFFIQQGTVLWAVRLPDSAPFHANWNGDKLHIQPVMQLSRKKN